MNRLPALLLLVALLGGLIVVEQTRDPVSFDRSTLTAGGPLAATGMDEGSTWYCTAGFSTPDGLNDHLIIVTNESDQPVQGSLTIFPSLPDTLGNSVPYERAVQPLELGPASQQVVSLAPVVAMLDEDLALDTGSFAAALVEFDNGGVIVEHAIVTPAGRDIGACATSAATNWWFASGTTTNEVTYQLYLLNPFPDDAVVDVTFVTDGGIREPTAFDGRLIPAQSLTMLDVTPVVPVWDQITTEVRTRTGRVVAERVQLFRNDEGPVGLSLTPGVNQMSDQWFFPAGAAVPGAAESYVIYNPNDAPAEVEFELKPDSADRAGDIAPLGVAMGPNERWVVNVAVHPTHPVATVATIDATTVTGRGERFFVTVRSFNGVPVVAERVLTRPIDVGLGVAGSFGITRASTDQTLVIPPWFEPPSEEERGQRRGELAVLNPAGDTISRVQVWVGGDDGATVREQAELAPRRRAAFDLNTLLRPGDRWLRVVSSTATMAELVVAGDDSVAVQSAVPDAGTISVPDLLSFD